MNLLPCDGENGGECWTEWARYVPSMVAKWAYHLIHFAHKRIYWNSYCNFYVRFSFFQFWSMEIFPISNHIVVIHTLKCYDENMCGINTEEWVLIISIGSKNVGEMHRVLFPANIIYIIQTTRNASKFQKQICSISLFKIFSKTKSR